MQILTPTNKLTKKLIQIVEDYERSAFVSETEVLKALLFLLYDEKALTGAALDQLIDRLESLPAIKATEEIRNQLKNREQ